jgi:glycosyltransferase involved in cell wall biosynthesis
VTPPSNGPSRLTEGLARPSRRVAAAAGSSFYVSLVATRVDPAQPVGTPLTAEDLGGTRKPTRHTVSVVVPLFNEAATISALYDEVHAALEPTGMAWEVVYVDDGSTDSSYRELVKVHAANTNVRVVRLRRNFGKAAALAAGFEAAGGDVVVTMDADLQDDPAEIPALVEKLDEGFDLVSGWKRDRQDPFSRRLVSHVYNTVSSWVTRVQLHDMNCGLKAYRSDVLENVRLYGELHRFVPVLAHQLGYGVTEIPVNHRPRLNGRSRYGFERYLRGFFDLLTVAFMGRYRRRPLHLFGGIGFALGLSGSAILLYLTAIKIGGASIGGRPLLMLGVLLVVVGIQFFSLGLVGEMLTSHHEEKAKASETTRRFVRDVLR